MTGPKRKLAKAAASIAAAFAVWIFAGEEFHAAVRAAFPAAPNLASRPAEAGTSTASAGPATANPAEGSCAVVRVIDGDTVRVRCGDQPEEPVRLVGVDAPEVARQGKPAECGAASSTAALAAALGEGPVYLRADKDQGDRDRYGRLLRFIATSSAPIDESAPWEGSVNLWLVREGASGAYANLKYGGREDFAAAAGEARAAGRGLWGICSGA